MKMIMKVFIILSIGAVVSCGSPEGENKVNNETSEADTEVKVETATDAENNMENAADYLITAHINSQLQVALGKVAAQKSRSPQLQEFGQQLMSENQQIQRNIDSFANQAGIDIEPALTPEYSSVIDSVQSLSGQEFDMAFLELVIEEHNQDIERFTTLSSKIDNPITRNMIADNLDILTRRLNKAEELKDKLD